MSRPTAPERARPVPAPSGPVVPPRPTRLALESLGVASIAWIWSAVVFRIGEIPGGLPFDPRSPASLSSLMVNNIEDGGGYLNQPRLGAPFGQQFYDFPHGGESLQLGAMKVLVWLTGDWGLAINLYFLAGTGVLAAVTYLVLRHLRFGPVIAGVAALVYTFLPFHFTHGEMHLWRSNYYSAPLAALLLVWATSWRERFLRNPTVVGWRSLALSNLRRRRVAWAVVVAMVIGSTETMTAGFTMTLLGVGAVVAAVRWREPQRLVVAGALVAVMGLTFAVLSYPTLNYYRAYGTNEEAARRIVTESEWYGLKISRLVTPQGGHRFGPLSSIGERAQQDSIVPSEGGQALGILGTAGFLGALYAAVAGRRRRVEGLDVLPGWDRTALRDHAAVFTVLGLVFGTIGGFAVLFAMAGFSQVRVWDRILLIIAFFAATIVAMWAEHLTGWVRTRVASPRPVLAGLAVAVLAFGLWDGIPPVRQSYAAIEARHANDRAFVAAIDEKMPDGTAIFQLPVLAFPEVVPPGRMLDYDPLRGFLADQRGSLRWSYGSVKGRPSADWQVYLRDHVGPVGALPALLGLGFEGLWVDTYGYTDDGAEIAQIREAVGVEPLVSDDGRFLFFDLRPYRERLGMTDEQLRAETRRLLHVDPPDPS